VFAASLLNGDPAGAVVDLYVLPVALVAVAFGRRTGIAAGLLGAGLIAVSPGPAGMGHSVLGSIVRAVAVVLVAAVLGDASDRLWAAHRLRTDIAIAAERHREAIEVNDGLVQGMAAAKWLLESGRRSEALATLDETLLVGQRLVSKLIRDAHDDADKAACSRRSP
jgi:hypothetical protein